MRSSLDVLDRVIGEFDDGLLSSTESEAASRRGGRHASRSDLRHLSEDEDDDDIEDDDDSGKEAKIRPTIIQKAGRPPMQPASINDQIDDIFSELTEELYIEDKRVRGGSSGGHGRRFDPLPSPPPQSHRTHPPPVDRKKKPSSGKGQQVHGDDGRATPEMRSRTIDSADRPRPGAVLAAKQSFQKQQQEQQQQQQQQRQSKQLQQPRRLPEGLSEEVVLYTGGDNRSVSSERITVEVHAGGHRHHPHSPPPPPPEKHRIHLKKNTNERPANSSGKAAKKPAGSGSGLSGQEAALMQELKKHVEDKQGKVSKFSHNKNSPGGQKTTVRDFESGGGGRRDNNDPLPPPPPSRMQQLPTSPQSSVSQRSSSSHPYESLPGGGSSSDHRRPVDRHASDVKRAADGNSGGRRPQMAGPRTNAYQGSRDRRPPKERDETAAGGGRDSRRSRSTGPLEMSRRLDSPAARLDEQRRSRRSRSRGGQPSDNDEDPENRDTASLRQRRSRSRGRDPRLGGSSFRQGSRGHEPSEGPLRRSRSRGRSPRERSPSRRRGEGGDNDGQRRRREFSPPSPEEAQATLEKMLSR